MQTHLYVDKKFVSPYTFSSFVALTELGMPFEMIEVDLEAGEHRQNAYRSHSFTGRIPSLNRGKFWLAESSAIAEYLQDLHPGASLLPKDPEERAQARMVMAWLRSDLNYLREERPTTSMFLQKATTPLTAACEQDVKKLFDFYDNLLGQNKDSLFKEWCLADAEISFMLHRLILNDHPVPAHLEVHATHNWQRPSVQSFVKKAMKR